jgi:hypothetical protein
VLNGWIAGVVLGLAVAAIGTLFVIKRIRSEGDAKLSIPLPLVKEFNLAKTSISLSIIIVGLIICFGSLYMLTRSYSPNFSNKIGRYTGQPVSSDSTFNKSGATMLSINNIKGEDVEATIHSDRGLYGDGQLSGTISGNDPVMTLNGTITGYTGRYPLKSYTANIELQCQFPSQNQTECSYSLSPESDNSISTQNGNMTLSKGST